LIGVGPLLKDWSSFLQSLEQSRKKKAEIWWVVAFPPFAEGKDALFRVTRWIGFRA
jgi:hypothetical protein